MTLFRFKKNGYLYTITSERGRGGYKAHPYKHSVEIGVKFHSRWRDFKSNMTLADFVEVAEA